MALGAVVLLVAMSGSLAQSPHASEWAVLAIDQTNYTTEQSTFTVSIEVASPASVTLAYFTFCQLSSPVCYKPVEMTLQGTNWFEGTTQRMATYDGMTVGVHAGYNITIDYANSTNVTEPNLPNSFSSLTVAQEVGGEYMFEMSVENQLYGLSGDVSDSGSHAGVAGASVALTPGNGTTSVTTSSGAYSFSGLANGTYTVAVTKAGYPTSSTTVTVAGQNEVQNIALTNASAPMQNPSTKSSGNGALGFLTSASGLIMLGVVAVVVVLGAVFAVSMSRKRTGGAPPPSGSASAESSPTTPEPPP
ncbi:MAG: carboxypeptidase-like regulatory domain-containing protein [Thermoplasmata archaeon]|nr:carboxypeptidase-like regulatory domain-containing protein [Thermoplasmata archaeon]